MLMRGVTGVRGIIADYLSVAMPQTLVVARQDWLLNQYQLPDPVRYDSYDPLTASEYPVIGSLVVRSSNFVRRDYDSNMAEEYDVRYATRVFMWARTPQLSDGTFESPPYEATLRVRDDLALALRATLLNSLSMGGNEHVCLQEGSMSEEYFDAIRSSSDNNRWMAGVTFAFDLDVTESLSRLPLGTADTITVEEETLSRQTGT